jgi:D-serine deaminase-like pyridoxal phosphate-dependent protein
LNKNREKERGVQTSFVGLPISELDTPALLVDLDALERNITAMARDIAAAGAAWRPHTKALKTPAIAHRELAAGAIGVTVAKLGEAEVMAASGIRDILIANQIVGDIKTRRLAALCRQADLIVAVDSLENVRQLDDAARRQGTRPRVVVEVNTGMNRCGVDPVDVVTLAHEVAACDGLRFVGVMAWEGHTMDIADPAERERAIREAVGLLVSAAEACREAGLPVEIVSCGGSATYLITASIPGVTEVQAGGGVFGDARYVDLGARVEPALTLMAQVISRPKPDRVIIDAGRKTIDPTARQPSVRGLAVTKPMGFSAEHGKIYLDTPCPEPRIGDRLEFGIGYSDQVVHLHEALYGVRGGIVETVWPVAARGKLQ